MTTVRLNDDIDNKLVLLKDLEKATKTEIIKRAIVEYYEHHIQEKTPYELGENLFGRAGSEKDLSQNYKMKLKGKLNEKHAH
jgi:predicted DNA-binding protein